MTLNGLLEDHDVKERYRNDRNVKEIFGSYKLHVLNDRRIVV